MPNISHITILWHLTIQFSQWGISWHHLFVN